MPIYEYECKNRECLHVFECIKMISACDEQEFCRMCSWPAKRIVSASSDRREWEPYVDENLGHEPVLVESREHRERLKKERGLTDQYHHKAGMPGQWI